MSVTPRSTRRIRKFDEACDYCYSNRIASALHRETRGAGYSHGFQNVEFDAVCICEIAGPCRDKNCLYYRGHV